MDGRKAAFTLFQSSSFTYLVSALQGGGRCAFTRVVKYETRQEQPVTGAANVRVGPAPTTEPTPTPAPTAAPMLPPTRAQMVGPTPAPTPCPRPATTSTPTATVTLGPTATAPGRRNPWNFCRIGYNSLSKAGCGLNSTRKPEITREVV